MTRGWLLVLLTCVACTGDDPSDPPRTESEAVLLPQRRACTFGHGATPAATLGVEMPLGDDLPFKHIVVIMQENRSFDNYLGRLVAQGYYRYDELDAPPPGWSNPDGAGGTVAPHPDDIHCITGLHHSWSAMHDDWNGGRNDHFVSNNNPNGARSFVYEDDTVIPFYYALASRFAVGDRYFASVMAATWPNRYFLMAATSFGIGDNVFAAVDTRAHPAPQIFSALEAAGRTWKDYTDGPHMQTFFPTFGFDAETMRHYGDVKCDLFNDIRSDSLPEVSFIMGDEFVETSDEDPSSPPGIGAEVMEKVVREIMASPAWKETVIFIAFDENGGLADHVPPVPACPPDGIPAHDAVGTMLPDGFNHTGFRVPFIVVSPWSRPHFVSHQIYDHTSITRLIEARFGLPALTARDANATPPFEMFDFAHPAFLVPPVITAHTPIDQAALDACGQTRAPIGCTP